MLRQYRRERRLSGILMIVLGAVLLVGLFSQIGQLAEISRQSKANDALAQEIIEMSAAVDNLEVALSKYHNLDNIRVRAEQLGMTLPDSSQIRVISLPDGMAENTSAQAASIGGGDEIH